VKAVASPIKHVFLVLVCLISIYPVWFVIQTGLKSNQEYMLHPLSLPTHLTLANFHELISELPVLTWILNSVIVTLSSAAAATGVALLAAYAFVFGRFVGARQFFNINIALMVVPPVTLLVPMFIAMVNLGLINQLPSAIIFYVGLFLPFSFFFMVTFLRTVPYDLIEAAKLDGVSAIGTLRRIVAPLAGPALFPLLLVKIIYAWNELLIALVFLQQPQTRTLMPGLALFQGRYVSQEPLVMAGAFLSVVPVLVLYIGGQRFFIRGLTAGIGK
jgi:ABC-type glycerol-3-phosphate transport system permease component